MRMWQLTVIYRHVINVMLLRLLSLCNSCRTEWRTWWNLMYSRVLWVTWLYFPCFFLRLQPYGLRAANVKLKPNIKTRFQDLERLWSEFSGTFPPVYSWCEIHVYLLGRAPIIWWVKDENQSKDEDSRTEIITNCSVVRLAHHLGRTTSLWAANCMQTTFLSTSHTVSWPSNFIHYSEKRMKKASLIPKHGQLMCEVKWKVATNINAAQVSQH
jgi:hypothetical protein